jgi:hypothetical protein
MGETNRDCLAKVSTIFVFDTPQFQNACNTIYLQKQTYDARQSTLGRKKRQQFKSDFERMQFLLGFYGQCPTNNS